MTSVSGGLPQYISTTASAAKAHFSKQQQTANMKAALVLLLVAALALVQCKPAEEGKYTSKYDNINVDEVLASDRLLNNYFECVMDRKPCTAEGSELKARIPDALKNECAKCTQKQRSGVEKVIKFLMKNKPQMWDELKAKYDPSGEYLQKYADRLKEVS